MKILVIGGTLFVGRRIVEEALATGHTVALFNRGHSDPGLFPGVEKITGDRTAGFSALGRRRWDAIIDTCGYRPDDVRVSAVQLRAKADRYVYISSAAAYAEWGVPDQDESFPLHPALPAGSGAEDVNYASRKAACDRIVAEVWGDAALIVRPGVIAGPFDRGKRLAYWLGKAVAPGEVLAPGDPKRVVQFIDARDLANWTVKMIGARVGGAFNLCGDGLEMSRLLDLCRTTRRGKADFVWTDQAFLFKRLPVKHDVSRFPLQYLDMLPFWIPGRDDRFLSTAAKVQGFTPRDPAETIRDTAAWLATLPGGDDGYSASHLLSAAKEQELLRAWRERRPAKSAK